MKFSRSVMGLALVLPALQVLLVTSQADSVGTVVGGQLARADNSCINIVPLLTGADCSYAATRYPATTSAWWGPNFIGAYYTYNSIKDNPANGVEPDGQDFTPSPNDGKASLPVSGAFSIDDGGTADGSDDSISGSFGFGAADHWVQTGNGDRALERWTAWNHTLASTLVSSATALTGGGFVYVIGSRGWPTPLVADADSSDRFPSENAPPPVVGDGTFWSQDVLGLPISQRIGIERSPGYGNTGNGGGASLQPNIGAQTTATLTGYECLDSDNDCVGSPFMVGSSLVPGSTVTLPPGFTNLIMMLTTDSSGHIISGEAYWTREFIIPSGPAIGDDLPGQFNTSNTWVGGHFTISTVPLPAAAWFVIPALGVLAPWCRRRATATATRPGVSAS